MLSERSKRMRQAAIGSSDVACLVGEDPHRGPLDVWMAKVGLGSNIETTAMIAGQELEAPIGRMYCRATGAKLHTGGGTLRHPKYPWAVATLDRRATGGPAQLVEIKNIGAWMMREWRESPPPAKLIQVTWQLDVAGLSLAHIAALLGGTSLRVYPVEYDREFAEMLRDVAHDFLRNHVTPALLAKAAEDEDWTRFAPPHTPIEAVDLANARYPDSDGRVLPCTLESRAVWRELEAAEIEEKAAKERRAAAEAAAKKMLGSADEIAGCFTWKTDNAGRVAWAQVAKAMNPTQDIINKHTGAPARRFLRKESHHEQQH
jgi:putative phage-type endonuclease